jgi:3'(2'), 5'-bisphosphate nucleotidase
MEKYYKLAWLTQESASIMTKTLLTTEKRRAALETCAADTALAAGRILMEFYAEAAKDPSVLATEIKDDNSPVTAADKASHDFILKTLRLHTPAFPVISEEDAHHPHLAAGRPYWVVDPLDGTKEFLHRTGGFAVKIALIDNDTPVAGAVFSPAQNALYHSRWNAPAIKTDTLTGAQKTLATRAAKFGEKGSLRVLFNEKHANKDAYAEMRIKLKNQGLELPATPDGLAGLPRNLQVAEGLADIFADCGRYESLQKGCGYSWDYAPDWLILKNAGGMMAEIVSGREPDFRDPAAKRNAYVAIGDKKLGTNLFPNYP